MSEKQIVLFKCPQRVAVWREHRQGGFGSVRGRWGDGVIVSVL